MATTNNQLHYIIHPDYVHLTMQRQGRKQDTSHPPCLRYIIWM